MVSPQPADNSDVFEQKNHAGSFVGSFFRKGVMLLLLMQSNTGLSAVENNLEDSRRSQTL